MQKIKTAKNCALCAAIGAMSIMLVLALSFVIPVFSEDKIDGNYIKIGEDVYLITDTESLVDADLAFLRNESLGSAGKPVSGVIGGQKLSGMAEVYDALYDKLLENVTHIIKNGDLDGQYRTFNQASVSSRICKLDENITMTSYTEVVLSARVIFVSEKPVTITLKNNSDASNGSGRFTMGYNAPNDASQECVFAFQGRNAQSMITIQGEKTTQQLSPAFRLFYDSNLYLNYTELTGFKFGASESGDAVIYVANGYNAKRCLYMTNSSMHDISGAKSPGIFLKAYVTSSNPEANNKNVLSELNLYKNEFYNCVTIAQSNYAGGPVIRSFAADNCQLRMEECRLYNNHNYATGTASGGGAIYWKSAAGNANIINCVFENNSAALVGGAIYNTGNMTITGCEFYDNEAAVGGGAIAAEPPRTSQHFANINTNGLKGSLTLDSSTILSGNSSPNGRGGAIYFNAVEGDNGKTDDESKYMITKYEMELNINGATIENNEAKYGGGVAMWLAFLEHDYTTGITIAAGSTIQNNRATSGNGGAIWMGSDSTCWCKDNSNKISGVTMNGGTLQGNHAQNGGAIYIETGKADAIMNFNLTGGSVQNNQATVNGGAAYIAGGNFTMSGGTMTGCTAQTNGGAIYLKSGLFTISSGSITECKALQGSGGASFIQGGNFTMSGGNVTDCTAQTNGGAICVDGGSFSISDGTVTGCTAAANGGAVYVSGGDATMSGGTMTECTAAQNGGAVCVEGGSFTLSKDGTIYKTTGKLGGAVYVSGGNAYVNGGELNECSAEAGGAIYVQGGTVTMLGGAITNNKATNGNGGAILVTGSSELNVTVQSGEISGNSASANGGAISVIGQSEVNPITVQIGVNYEHYDADGNEKDCDHNGNDLDGDGACPVVKNNVCLSEGGAIYIAGTKQTNLKIYCIEELGNRGAGNAAGSKETSLSDFLKVDGGKVLISAENPEGAVYYGDSVINSSVHVTGGDLELQGTIANPAILAPITVDVLSDEGEAIGSFTDERVNDGNTDKKYYVVKYFENFTEEGAANPTGQYTVHQALWTEDHTVWGVIYSHTGLTIVGWNTQADGKGESFGVSSVVSYDEFKDYLEKDITLELYAIWAKNFYWIKFDPAVDSYTGSMGEGDEHKQSFLCAAESTPLPANGFVNLGYKFLGWSVTEGSDQVKYQNGQDIPALTQTVGEVITLYAVWALCDHTESGIVYEQVSGATVTCTCQCSYYLTVTITAPANAVYNKSPHAPTLETAGNSNGKFNLSYIPGCSVEKIGYTYEPFEVGYGNDDNVNTDAGNYTATLTVGDKTVTVDYKIAKAPQPAPDKPVFDVNDGTKELTVTSPVNRYGESGNVVEYSLYYRDENGQPNEPTWQTGTTFNNYDKSWTLYYIAAYYPGNNNYEASEEVVSDQKYLFQGEIIITVIDPEGMKTELNAAEFVSHALLGYYIQSGYGLTVSGELTDSNDNVVLSGETLTEHFKRQDGAFAYTVTAFDDGLKGEITLTFKGAKHVPTVEMSVAPNEQFGAVTDVATTIGKDSAFTAYFEVNYYDQSVYSTLTLTFDKALPANTTIIMVDKVDGSYWYYKVAGNATTSILISGFSQMGGSETNSPTIRETGKYQFIVDFSDVAKEHLLGEGALSVKLTATVIEAEKNYAPVLQETGKGISLVTISHSLGTPSVDGTSASVSVGYAQGTEYASKWEEREATLVLIPDDLTKLPIDATVTVIETVGVQPNVTTRTTTASPDNNGNFVITLDRGATALKIVLQSQMFTDASYEFTLQLHAAYEGDAPMNEEPLATQTMTLISKQKAQNSAYVTVDIVTVTKDEASGTETIEVITPDISACTLTDTINVKIKKTVGSDYTATVTLLKKNSEGEYISTGWSQDLTTQANRNSEEHSFIISSLGDAFGEGSFCLSLVVRDASNTAVLTVPYYFMIQKTSE